MNIDLNLISNLTFLRSTLAEPLSLSGRALFSGQMVSLRIHPSTQGGIFFLRSDLQSPVPIPATIECALAGYRTTTLASAGQKIQTVEHLLSALFALGITDALIEVDGPEIPILDGSALPFARALFKAGILPVGSALPRPILKTPVSFACEGSYLLALPAEKLTFSYLLDYGDHPLLQKAYVSWDGQMQSYVEHIAQSRTFCLYEEALAMQNSNAVLGFSDQCAVVFGKESIMMGAPLRQPHEPAYHKLLDLIGDLSLVTIPVCHIIGIKSGHKTHLEFAKRLGGYSG